MGIDFSSHLSARRVVALALTALLVLTAVAVAFAGDPHSDRHPQARVSGATAVSATLRRAMKSRNPVQMARTLIDPPPPPAYRGPDTGRDITRRSRIVAAAVDWPYSYYAVAKESVAKFSESEDTVPTVLVRRNLVTGQRNVVLRLRKSLFTSLRAGGGRAYVGLFSFAGEMRATTSIYGGAHDAPRFSKIDTAHFKIETLAELPGFCGGITSLSGTTPSGEAIVSHFASVCPTSGGQTLSNQMLAIDPAGASRTLDPLATTAMVLYSDVKINGNRLVETGKLGGAVDTIDAATGDGRRLWADSESDLAPDSSIAGDGSVIVGPAIGRSDYSYDGDEVNTADPQQHPFVIFPQGVADSPLVLTDAGYRTISMRYCGDRLYELRATKTPHFNTTAASMAVLGGFAVVSDFQVWTRDLAGGAPQQIGTTGRTWIRDLACDGNTLVIATDERVRVGAQRFGS